MPTAYTYKGWSLGRRADGEIYYIDHEAEAQFYSDKGDKDDTGNKTGGIDVCGNNVW